MTVMRGNYDKARLRKLDAEHHLHPFTNNKQNVENGGALIFSRADGIYIWDVDNKRYIDGMSGLWCVNVGYGREELVEASSRQMRELPYYSNFFGSATPATVELAAKVTSLLGGDLGHVFFGCSGSDANDTAIKMVWYYNNLRGKPDKKKIVARDRAYHGVTIAAGSLTGLDTVHKSFDLPIARVLRTSAPYPYRDMRAGESEQEFARRLAADLDRLIEAEGPGTVAAFIAEPVMGAGGVIVPPATYFPEIQKVLSKHDVLMIADEVICGFGRLGTWFGAERLDIKPDMMTFAKGVTSGYQPLSGCILANRVWEEMLANMAPGQVFGHGFTYSAHPIAAAAGLANLDIMEREDLIGNADRVGAYFQKKLASEIAPHPLVGEVRGSGLIAGIELSADKKTKRPFAPTVGAARIANNHCFRNGLLSRPLLNSDILGFSPPLIITEPEVDELVRRLRVSLDGALAELPADVRPR